MILDKSGNIIDPLWSAEFRGLFWGEGHLSITQQKKLWSGKEVITGQFYRTAVMIDLRADDVALLQECQRVLGGGLYLQHPKDEHPRKRWATTNKEDTLRVCQVLSGGLLPAKKSKEVGKLT